MPFGRGYKRDYGRLNPLVSGWTISSIITWQSGAPLSILSSRGTLNRTARSVQNTPATSLTKPELDEIVKFRMTDDGPFMIDERAINPRDNTGVAADGEPAFPGQIFSHPEPGQLGVLQRRMFSAPPAFAFDLGVDKTIRLPENQSILVGAKVANALNHPVFFSGSHFLDDRQFGRISSVLVGARVIEFRLKYNF